MSRPKPNYNVKHIDGWEVNIYIAPSLSQKLRSRNENEQLRVKQSISIQFRKACKSKYRNWTDKYIKYEQLVITELPTSKPGHKPCVSPKPEERCCNDDDCIVCDIGNHYQCQQGCNIGR